MWDERVAIHERSAFYDLDGFRAGRSNLQPFEIEEVGAVDGLRLAHLQCHFGMDTLAWARLGATVVGVDFSAEAVATAQRLADELGLAGQATFVESDVFDARAALDGEFDLVYVTWGALIWLPDIARWAAVVASLLRPGGFLYLAEAHPYAGALHPVEGCPPSHLHQIEPYGGGAQTEWNEPGTYADPDAPTVNNQQYEWRHGLGEIISAVTQAGLRVDWVHERDVLVWPMWPTTEQGEDGLWRQPGSTLPLSFSLRATKP